MDVSTVANVNIYLPQLEDILEREVLTLPPDISLPQVLERLTQKAARVCEIAATDVEAADAISVRCAVVVEAGYPIGIVSEPDIIRYIALGSILGNYCLREVMTPHTVALAETEFTDVFAIIQLMQHQGIRHLPIVDDRGHFKGLITPESLRWVLRPANFLRMRSISEAMSSEVITAPPEATVLQLAKQMDRHRVGCIIIARSTPQGRYPVGIVTEGDILQYQVLELPLERLMASEVMSSPLLTLSPRHTLWDAHHFLQTRRIRRVAIVDEEGLLRGIVTQTGILQPLSSLDLYNVVQTLQQKVERLEREKQEILQQRAKALEAQVAERTRDLQTQTQQIQLASQRERILAESARNIRQSLDLQEILEATVESVGTFLKVDRATILKFAPDWQGTIVAEYTRGTWRSLLGNVICDPCFAPNWVEVYQQGRVRVVDDVARAEMSECHRELLEQLQIRAKILVPIVFQETDPEGEHSLRLWGLLSANQCRSPRQWQSFESEFLEGLATHVAIAIQQSELYQRTRADLAERKRMEAALRGLIVGTSDAIGKNFFPALVRHLASALGVRLALVTRCGKGGNEILGGWLDGDWRSLSPLDAACSPWQKTLAEGEYFCGEGFAAHYPRFAENLPFVPESYLGLTLANSRGRPIGTLAIADEGIIGDREHCQAILRVFAARAAAELERQSATQRLQALNQTLESRVIQRTNALQQSLKTLSDIKYALDRSAIIAITDPAGIVLEVNDKFCEISGYSREEIIGRTHALVNSGYHPSAFFARMWQTIQSGEVWRGEIKNRAKNGREYWVNTTIVPFFNEAGEPFQYLAIRTDITEQKKAEEAIAQLLEREKELSELKTRFITTASHEFRTPLALISSSTGILQDYGERLADAKRAKHLGRIQGAAQQMKQLLEDVLTVERIAADRLPFQPSAVNLIDFCSDLQGEFHRSYPQRQIHWQVNPPQPPSPTIQADPQLLYQILSNILSNALKYSHNNRPVSWGLSYHPEVVVFHVSDRGIGIPQADRERLFESFHRANNVGTIQGTGLGLAIVKKCVDLHGGQIGIESAEESGTTITIELPLTRKR